MNELLRISVVLMMVGISPVLAESSMTSMLSKYTVSFQTTDGLSRAVAIRDFDIGVSDSDKPQTLALLLNASADEEAKLEIACTVLIYLNSEPAKRIVWNEELKNTVLSLKTSKSRRVRSLLISLVAHLPSNEQNNLLRYYLADDDENIRMSTLDALARRPDGMNDIQSYASMNSASAAHAASVIRARELIKGN